MKSFLAALGLLLALIVPAFTQDGTTRNFATSQVTVAATATLTANFRGNRVAVTIQNHGTTAMFCGPAATVTTLTGFRLPGVDGASITIPSQAAVFCITAASTQIVSVLESY